MTRTGDEYFIRCCQFCGADISLFQRQMVRPRQLNDNITGDPMQQMMGLRRRDNDAIFDDKDVGGGGFHRQTVAHQHSIISPLANCLVFKHPGGNQTDRLDVTSGPSKILQSHQRIGPNDGSFENRRGINHHQYGRGNTGVDMIST